MRNALFMLLPVSLAVAYEIFALGSEDTWTISEILYRITESRFVLVALTWLIGFIMGHALAPHRGGF